MSDDHGYGQGNRYPGQPRRRPADDMEPQRGETFLEEATGSQSRRKFLRAAVMSGVGVAAVGATAGVAAACQKIVPIVQGNAGPTPTPVPSGTDPCSLCFEQSKNFQQISQNTFNYNHDSGSTQPGSFYFWFIARNVTSGTYTFSVSPDLGTHTAALPFQYGANGNSANSVKLFQEAANSTSSNCPSGLPTSSIKHQYANDMSSLGSFETDGSGNADLLLAIHFSFDGKLTTGNQDYTFTFTLKKGDTTICTKQATLHAIETH